MTRCNPTIDNHKATPILILCCSYGCGTIAQQQDRGCILPFPPFLGVPPLLRKVCLSVSYASVDLVTIFPPSSNLQGPFHFRHEQSMSAVGKLLDERRKSRCYEGRCVLLYI